MFHKKEYENYLHNAQVLDYGDDNMHLHFAFVCAWRWLVVYHIIIYQCTRYGDENTVTVVALPSMNFCSKTIDALDLHLECRTV